MFAENNKLNIPNTPIRLFTFIVDLLIVNFFSLILNFFLFFFISILITPEVTMLITSIFSIIIFYIVVPAIYKRTLSYILFNLYIGASDENQLSTYNILLRNVIFSIIYLFIPIIISVLGFNQFIIFYYLLVIGLLVLSLFNPQKRTFYDLISGSYVYYTPENTLQTLPSPDFKKTIISNVIDLLILLPASVVFSLLGSSIFTRAFCSETGLFSCIFHFFIFFALFFILIPILYFLVFFKNGTIGGGALKLPTDTNSIKNPLRRLFAYFFAILVIYIFFNIIFFLL